MAVREGLEPPTLPIAVRHKKQSRPFGRKKERLSSDSLVVTGHHDTVERFIGFEPNRRWRWILRPKLTSKLAHRYISLDKSLDPFDQTYPSTYSMARLTRRLKPLAYTQPSIRDWDDNGSWYLAIIRLHSLNMNIK